MNLITRFIDENELHYVNILYSIDRRSVGVKLTDNDLELLINRLKGGLERKTTRITMAFVDDSPVCMYVAVEIPTISGWYIGLTKIKESSNHFNKTATVMAPALDLMISTMESKGYFKFWMAAPEKHHNIRNKIIKNHSPMANRYLWFDERVAPRGELTDVYHFDRYRKVCDWSDILIRMFVLKQEHRVKILNQKSYQDYKGTITNI